MFTTAEELSSPTPTNPQPPIAHPRPKLPLFAPPEDKIPEILDQLDSPLLSLANVAGLHNTTVEALSLWMRRDDIRERNAHIDTAAAERNRSLATRMERGALGALALVLHNATEEEREQHFSDHPKASAARTKNRHLIVQAARLVQQLAKNDATPTPRKKPPKNTPAPSPAPTRKRSADPKTSPPHHRMTEYMNQLDHPKRTTARTLLASAGAATAPHHPEPPPTQPAATPASPHDNSSPQPEPTTHDVPPPTRDGIPPIQGQVPGP